MRRNIKTLRDDGLMQIANPTIECVNDTMWCRLKKGVGKKEMTPMGMMEHDGEFIEAVDVANQKVLVACCYGGTEEHYDWYPVSSLRVVWESRKS